MIYARATHAFAEVDASPEVLFDYLDDPSRIGTHMQKPSTMMLGGRMSYALDAAGGRAVGSVIRMEGNVLGLRLAVEEVIVDRRPPHDKVWETLGEPRLIVIGTYRMGFEIATFGAASRLRVFIEYNYPRSIAGRMAALMLGGVYAKWCVRRMTEDAQARFQKP